MAAKPVHTLAVAKRLERDFGFSPLQSEGIATVVHEQIFGSAASKVALLRDLNAKFDDLRRNIDVLHKGIDELRCGCMQVKIVGCAILVLVALRSLHEILMPLTQAAG